MRDDQRTATLNMASNVDFVAKITDDLALISSSNVPAMEEVDAESPWAELRAAKRHLENAAELLRDSAQ